MVKRSIGIDMGRFHLRAVQIAQRPDGFCVEKVFARPTRRSTDSPIDMLRALTAEQGFDRNAEVTACLPHHAIFFADIEVDAATLQELRAGHASSLRDDFPIAAEKAIVQVCSARPSPNGRHATLVATTSADLLGEQLTRLAEGKVHPSRIETPITAVHTAVGYNHPDYNEGIALLLVVDESVLSLAVVRDGNLIMVRNIPLRLSRDSDQESVGRQVTEVLGREIEITWRKLFGVDVEADLRVFLVAPLAIASDLTEAIQDVLGCRVILADPFARVLQGEAIEDTSPICLAEGLALRRLLPREAERIDFLRAHTAQTQSTLNLRKELAICGGLLLATAVVWFAGLFVHLSRLESQYGEVKTQIQDIFQATLPGEKCVDPLAQLQQKLDALHNDGGWLASFQPGRWTPLEILGLLSVHRPTEGDLEFDDVLIAGDSIRVIGQCGSFATFSGWQRVLEEMPGMEIVDEPKPSKDAKTGRVRFTLSLSSGRRVQ
jgi:Tfp pilus assembly PilM family ATPase